jgi:hypothetical protein
MAGGDPVVGERRRERLILGAERESRRRRGDGQRPRQQEVEGNPAEQRPRVLRLLSLLLRSGVRISLPFRPVYAQGDRTTSCDLVVGLLRRAGQSEGGP